MGKISPALLTFLVNAIWQVALVAAVASLAARLLRHAPARYRHGVWVAALLLAVVLPLTNSARLLPMMAKPAKPRVSAAPAVVQIADEVPAPPASAATPLPQPATPIRRDFAIPQRLAAVLIGMYLAFVFFRLGGLARAWCRTRTLVRCSARAEFSDAVQRVIAHCRQQTGSRNVHFLTSTSVATPLTVGSVPAVVVLPEKLLHETDEAILTSAIGHELVHVQRRDYVLNFFYRLLYIPLSFHPAAALIQRRIDQTRELRCDEVVTDRLLSPTVYARSLVELAGAAHAFRRPATIAVGIADADILEERIMSMLKKRRISSARRTLLLATAALVFTVPCIAAAPYALRLNIAPAPEAQVAAAVAAAPVLAATPTPAVVAQQEEKPVKAGSAGWEAVTVDGKTFGVAYTADGQEQSPQESEARLNRKMAEAKMTGEQARQILEKKLAEGQLTPEQTVLLKRKLEEMSLSERQMSPQEREARAKAEREELAARARRLAELSKAAKITMQQAIDAALIRQPGTVMESALVGERKLELRSPDGSVTAGSFASSEGSSVSPMYRIVILSGADSAPVRTIVLVNAVDGTIIKSVVE